MLLGLFFSGLLSVAVVAEPQGSNGYWSSSSMELLAGEWSTHLGEPAIRLDEAGVALLALDTEGVELGGGKQLS